MGFVPRCVYIQLALVSLCSSRGTFGGIGQDNPSDECSTGAINFATLNVSQHTGPFDGVSMGKC